MQKHINDSLDTARFKVRELNKIEGILKTILRYRGYNKKNLAVRIERLAKADQIEHKDLKLVREIMKRQNMIAGDLTEMLTFILKLYEVKDIEIKELTKDLKEYEKK